MILRIVAILVVFPMAALAQEVLAASGGYLTSFQSNYQFTVGELVIQTYDDPAYAVLTQGFHQPDIYIYPSNVGLDDGIWENFKLYPNPNHGQFYVELQAAPWNENAAFFITDHAGQMIDEGVIPSNPMPFDLTRYASGAYELTVRIGQQSKRFKILKVQ